MSPRAPSESSPGRSSGFALAGVMGGYVVLCTLVGLGVGLLADIFLHTAPVFLIAGVVLGFAVSFFVIYRLAMGALDE